MGSPFQPGVGGCGIEYAVPLTGLPVGDDDSMPFNTAQITAHLTGLAAKSTGRHDIIVRLDQQLPVPAQFDLAEATISMNLLRLLDPPEVDRLLAAPTAAEEFPHLLGALIHEVGHADHTRFHRLPPPIAEWATVIEEPRIEKVMVDKDPANAPLLAASAARVLGEAGDAIAAMELMVLLGGRVLAGVFPAARAKDALGRASEHLAVGDADRVLELTGRGVELDDDDLAGLVEVADALHQIAARYSTTGRPSGAVVDVVDSSAGDEQEPESEADPGSRDEDVADRIGSFPPPQPGSEPRPAAAMPPRDRPGYIGRNARFMSSTLNAESAADWFSVTTLPAPESEGRAATPADHRRVHQLGSWLSGQHTPAQVATRTATAAPPGRLHMSELVRATAQHDLGLPVTATPWTRQRTREAPTAAMDVGLIVDRSDSMGPHMEAVAETAWTLAQALARPVGRAQTWVFSDIANTLPVADVDQIVVPHAHGGTIALLPAIEDYARWTPSRDRARVCLILSDGALYGDPVRDVLARLAADGVVVAGLAPTADGAAALADHLPETAPISVLGADLLDQVAGVLAAHTRH